MQLLLSFNRTVVCWISGLTLESILGGKAKIKANVKFFWFIFLQCFQSLEVRQSLTGFGILYSHIGLMKKFLGTNKITEEKIPYSFWLRIRCAYVKCNSGEAFQNLLFQTDAHDCGGYYQIMKLLSANDSLLQVHMNATVLCWKKKMRSYFTYGQNENWNWFHIFSSYFLFHS